MRAAKISQTNIWRCREQRSKLRGVQRGCNGQEVKDGATSVIDDHHCDGRLSGAITKQEQSVAIMCKGYVSDEQRRRSA
jgi:hypothetical protein